MTNDESSVSNIECFLTTLEWLDIVQLMTILWTLVFYISGEEVYWTDQIHKHYLIFITEHLFFIYFHMSVGYVQYLLIIEFKISVFYKLVDLTIIVILIKEIIENNIIITILIINCVLNQISQNVAFHQSLINQIVLINSRLNIYYFISYYFYFLRLLIVLTL